MRARFRFSAAHLAPFAVAALALSLVPRAHAFRLIGGSWPTGPITMQLQLDATRPTTPAFPLIDGSTSWNQVAQAALADWNTALASFNGRCRLTGIASTAASNNDDYGNGLNNVVFRSNIYGQNFDSRTLAVTLTDDTDDDGFPTARNRESDILLNRGIVWNSYRGPGSSNPFDLRRALLHELGHTLGLDHPDQGNAPQAISSVMNSTIDNISETPTADDRAALAMIYRDPVVAPVVTAQPVSRSVSVGSSLTLAAGLNGSLPTTTDAVHTYRWYFQAAGAAKFEPLFTVSSPQLPFGSAQTTDAGSYYLVVTTPDGVATTNTVTLTVNPVALAANTSLANLSTRGLVGPGVNSMIVGFAITGTGPKNILLRGVAPTLASAYGVTGTLGDPVLTVQNKATGAVIASNDDWENQTGLTTAENLRTTAARVGAFPLAAGAKDAAVLLRLEPGTYSAVVSAVVGGSGVVLVEAYDADLPSTATAKLSNLSTRAFVGTADNVLIAGFNLTGSGPKTYLLRVVGDSLIGFGVSGTLDDCYLRLYRGPTLIREQDDWDSPAAIQPLLRTTADKVGAFPLVDRQECAMLVTLTPGTYSAVVRGFEDSTGVALVELYEVPE